VCSSVNPCDICINWSDWQWQRLEANRLRKLRERMARDSKKEKDSGQPPAKRKRSDGGGSHKSPSRVQHPETEKPEKDIIIGEDDPGIKVPVDDPGKSFKKPFEAMPGPSGHSSPVEEKSELDISSGGADSEGYVGDFTVDESQVAGDTRAKRPGKTERPIYDISVDTSGKMAAEKRKKKKKVYKSSDVLHSGQESDREFPLGLAERLRSKKEMQAELQNPGKPLKPVASRPMSTPGKDIPGKTIPGKTIPGEVLPGDSGPNRSPGPDSLPVTVNVEVYDSKPGSGKRGAGRSQNTHRSGNSNTKTVENPAVSNAELEIHAPEEEFDIEDDDQDKTGKKSSGKDQLFSIEQMKFLGTYLKDMLLAIMKPASAYDMVNTTLSKIGSVTTKRSDKVKLGKSVIPPPSKKRKIETLVVHQSNHEDSEEKEYDEDCDDDHEGYQYEAEEYDEEDDDDENDDEDDVFEKHQKKALTLQETDLKEEEKQEDSMNLSLAEQLARIQSYFPDKVLSTEPPKQKVERPQDQVRKPTITGLPLHQLIQDNLQQLREEVMKGNSKYSTDKENAGFDTGKFPKSYTLRKKYQPSDIPEFGQNYKEDSMMERLAWNPKKLATIKEQQALDVKGARRIATDLKKSLAVNSWGVWFAKANKILLNDLYEKIAGDKISMEEALEEVKMAANLNCSMLNAAKESALFSSMALVTDTLAQRDAYLKIMDKDLPADNRIKLRSAPFNGVRLFEGQTEEAKKALKDVKDNKDRVIQVNITQGKGQNYVIPKKGDKDGSSYKQDSWRSSNNWRSSQDGNSNNNNNSRGRTFFRGSRYRPQNNSNNKYNKSNETQSKDSSQSFRGRGRGRGRGARN